MAWCAPPSWEWGETVIFSMASPVGLPKPEFKQNNNNNFETDSSALSSHAELSARLGCLAFSGGPCQCSLLRACASPSSASVSRKRDVPGSAGRVFPACRPHTWTARVAFLLYVPSAAVWDAAGSLVTMVPVPPLQSCTQVLLVPGRRVWDRCGDEG